MKPSLPILISVFFLLLTAFTIDLQAGTEGITGYETAECQYLTNDDPACSEENPCYSPGWHYTYDITHNSAYFEWEPVYGASYYTVQWRYPGGSWNNLGGNCYQTWIYLGNLQSCSSYEWRVKSHCGYGYSSSWCYPVYFTTLCHYCQPPQWLQCYDITTHSATWKWDDVYGADYYSVQWRYAGGSWYDLYGGPFYGTWVNVNHLNPCTTYEWRVKSYCHYGGWSNWCYPYTFTTHCDYACATPTGLITKDVGDTKATFKWNPVNGAHNYSVQIRDHYGYWHDVPGSPTSGIWITAYNLLPCHTYEWRVKANCHYYASSYWSPPQTFTTTCGNGCYAPEWVYTNGISSSSAVLHWTSVIGADYYVVEWRPGGGTWQQLQAGSGSSTVLELTGLQPSTNYEWRVKSHCHTGHFSGWSSVTSFTTLGASCGMPFFRYTLPITETSATFNWSAVAGALNYTVQYRIMNGQWQDVVGSPTTNTSITVNGLQPNTQYEWRMQVNCSNGAYSIWLSPVMFTTASQQSCRTPGSLYADHLTLNSATLHWNHIEEAETYSVEIRQLPSGPWTTVAGSPVDTNFIVVDGLSPFTTYEWRVRSNCAGGNHSFWSAAWQFTTTDLSLCDSPEGLAVDTATETTAVFSWLSVSGSLGYQVQTRLPNGTWLDQPGGSTTDTFLLASGFTPNTSYEWRVRTQCDSSHYSAWTVAQTFTTTGSGQGNDDCVNAMLLTVGTTCVSTFASNVDANASTPPPAGGCFANGYRDVWFRFNMPDVPNPNVTIRTSAGSLGNAVMEVYSGADCGILSLIACEDNNDNGNGSSMPVINLTGTQNATIWVRVWGFDGSTGSFTICVFDHISFNYAETSAPPISFDGETFATVEESVPVADEVYTVPELLVSPNPVSDELHVDVLQADRYQVIGLRMLDLSGQVIYTQKGIETTGNHFKTNLDVSGFVPGMYLLQVQTTQGILSDKVMVVK